MPKTVAPGSIDIPGIDRFETNAVPDPFDARDLEYLPRLQALPNEIDQRAGGPRYVYMQSGQSCTGHSVAAVINHVLSQTAPSTRVSPYMLYRLARRYDQFPGEADAGSSLRAAFKGWFNHGVALESSWPSLKMKSEPDPDNEANLQAWRDRPLGAFYRVNPYRLDDVQSAISELTAIAVSGTIHDGWTAPVRVKRGRDELYVIRKLAGAKPRGGHAYCVVGYNEVGFLVQNSWGTSWGKGGFATLPYEDWLDSTYDAWVARPGVPQTPFSSGRRRTATVTGGALATSAGPDLRRLSLHVVNTGNDGLLSSDGKFVSTPAQVERVIEHMTAWHEFFLRKKRTDRRHILIWSHGGGVSEASGLDIAQRQLNWWLNSGVFPISTVWETGPFETLSSAVDDLLHGNLPSGGLGFDLVEQFDRLVEGQCRQRLRWAWREMKDNARRASASLPTGTKITWPASSADLDRMAELPGASLLVDRLAGYVKTQGADQVAIHLAGHSAGSVYQASMVERLRDAGLTVETMTWLAPAITVDEFRQRVVPLLGPGKTVKRFSCFDLNDSLELHDTVGPVYHKSAVYLVARGFEDALGKDASEVPLVGLAKSWETPLDGPAGKTLRQVVEAAGGELIVGRSGSPLDARTDATTHAGFDNDPFTMTSVLMRTQGATTDAGPYTYQSDPPLRDAAEAPWSAAGPIAAGAVARPAPRPRRTRARGGAPVGAGLAAAAAEALPIGADGGPLMGAAGAPPSPPRARRTRRRQVPEVAAGPRTGSPILDVLQATGWTVAEPPVPRKTRKQAG